MIGCNHFKTQVFPILDLSTWDINIEIYGIQCLIYGFGALMCGFSGPTILISIPKFSILKSDVCI